MGLCLKHSLNFCFYPNFHPFYTKKNIKKIRLHPFHKSLDKKKWICHLSHLCNCLGDWEISVSLLNNSTNWSWSSSEHEQKPKLVFLGKIKTKVGYSFEVCWIFSIQTKYLRQTGESGCTHVFGVCHQTSIISCIWNKLKISHQHELVQHHPNIWTLLCGLASYSAPLFQGPILIIGGSVINRGYPV